MNPQQFFSARAMGLIVLVVAIAVYAFKNTASEPQTKAANDHKNAEYIIEGERVRLVDGVAEAAAAPDSSSKVITRYFGNEVSLDLNDDGREDKVFLLTRETGGSGTFYYTVAALNTDGGYIGSQGLLLGDRIAPQTTEKGRGKIVIINYVDRAPGEPFSTAPSVGKSIWLLFDAQTMQFGEVAQNFEGEADPAKMTLRMKPWTWISALYNDGREVRPRSAKSFTLTFGNDGKFSATTDCNSVGGSYRADGEMISFSEIYSTLMYCEDAQESEFVSLLENTSGYHFTSRGELVLDLKFDSGSAIFR